MPGDAEKHVYDFIDRHPITPEIALEDLELVLRVLDRSPWEPYTGSSEIPPAAPSDERGYSGTAAAQIVGITYRQLDYWARTDLVRPSAGRPGEPRRYSYRDLLELRMIKNLLDAGIRLEMVRDVFAHVRASVNEDITSANLVISGNQVILCTGPQLVDVVTKGQGVLNVLPLANVKNEIDEAIIRTHADQDASAGQATA